MQNQEEMTRDEESRSLEPEKLKGKAIEIAEEIKARGNDQLEAGKKTAAQGVEQLAGALDEATESLQRGEQQSLAGYAQDLAATVRSLAANLRDRSLDDLIGETQTLARRNPTMFFFGSVAVGIALSRFLKASGERQESQFPDNIIPSGVVRPISGAQRTQQTVGRAPDQDRSESGGGQTENPAHTTDIPQKGV